MGNGYYSDFIDLAATCVTFGNRMPLIIQLHTFTSASASYFSRVLADQPDLLARLDKAETTRLMVQTIFNGQPVALLLASRLAQGCRVDALVVHPATRGRGVGRETLLEGVKLLPAPVSWGEQMTTLAQHLL